MLHFKLLPGKRWGIISQRSRAWGVMFQQYFRGSPRLLKRAGLAFVGVQHSFLFG